MRHEKPEEYKIEIDKAVTAENLPSWRYFGDSIPVAGKAFHAVLNTVEAQQKRIQELEKALKPFAQQHKLWVESIPNYWGNRAPDAAISPRICAPIHNGDIPVGNPLYEIEEEPLMAEFSTIDLAKASELLKNIETDG